MKILALVLLDAVLAAKFALRAHVASQDAASCKGNVLPADLAAGPHKTLGKAQFSDVIDADKLRAALEASQFWIVGKSWELSMTANSMRQDPVTYAFTGGGHGFLTLTVPGGVVDEVLYATDTVKSLAKESGFEYGGKDAVVTDHDVILTNLCLRPKTCGFFKECLPISDFKPVEDPEAPGNTREDCCIPLMCKDTQPCNSTKYVPLGGTAEVQRLGNFARKH